MTTILNSSVTQIAWMQVWQVTIVAAGLGVFARLFCSRRPHLAYILWLVVLVKLLTPPLLSSPTSVFSLLAMPSQHADAVVDPRSVQNQILPSRTEAEQPAVSQNADKTYSPINSLRENADIVMQPASRTHFSLLSIMAVVWLMGTIVCGGFTLFVVVRCWRTVRNGQVPMSEPLQLLLASLKSRLKVGWHVRLYVVSQPLGPLTYGWLHPAIVLPQELVATTSTEELEPLIAHELIHVRRGDAIVGLFQAVAQCLWWFHPLVWWVNRRIAYERERCCDEEVLASMRYPPSQYAHCLLNVLSLKQHMRWLSACSEHSPTGNHQTTDRAHCAACRPISTEDAPYLLAGSFCRGIVLRSWGWLDDVQQSQSGGDTGAKTLNGFRRREGKGQKR